MREQRGHKLPHERGSESRAVVVFCLIDLKECQVLQYAVTSYSLQSVERGSHRVFLWCYIRQYKKHRKIHFLFLMPHLECNVWLCHMLSRADQLWLLNTLYPSERDPISHFKRLGDREQSLPRGEDKKKQGWECCWKTSAFHHGFTVFTWSAAGSLPCPIPVPLRVTVKWCLHKAPQRQSPYLNLQLVRKDFTWLLNAGQI